MSYEEHRFKEWFTEYDDIHMHTPVKEKLYSSDYILDEDQTVRWNREEVKRRNNEIHSEYENAKSDYKRRCSENWSKLGDVIRCIDVEITDAQAEKLFYKALDLHEYDGWDVIFMFIEEIWEEYISFKSLGE